MVETRVQVTLENIAEFAGQYPTIPLPPGMLAELGDDALFVTLPIGKVGARSRNGRTYTRAAVQAIVDAVNTQKPEGRWGHLRDDERGTRYDPPAIRWLAAMMDGQGVAWAKGIPVTAEAREHFRIAKIAGSRVGTSVYGFGQMEGENVVAFELETIDLADPNRVGIPDTAAQPLITKEQIMKETKALADRLNSAIDRMATGDTTRASVIERMAQAASIESGTVNQILNNSIDQPPLERLRGFARVLEGVSFDELRRLAGYESEANMTITINDVPENVRQQILEQFNSKQNGERISEMETQISELQTQITTLTGERDAARGEASKLMVTYARAQIAEQVQLEPVRKLVERMVGIRETEKDGATIDGVSSVAELDAAIKSVIEDETVAEFNKETVKEMMGPNLNPNLGKKGDGQSVLGERIPG